MTLLGTARQPESGTLGESMSGTDTDPALSAGRGGSLPPHPTLGQYYREDAARPGYIRQLFDASAQHYDRISAIMSCGTDKRYRREVLLREGLVSGMSMLDVACGTGLVSGPATEIAGPAGRVVSLDPSPGMLGEAVRQGRTRYPLLGMGEHLPFADESFDFLCMGFALRHVADLQTALGEYKRVLKPGAKVLLLEITPPATKASYPFFKFYLKSLIPFITRVSTGNREAQSLMSYFWDTVEQCVPPPTILAALADVGFAQVDRRIEARIFSEYTAIKP